MLFSWAVSSGDLYNRAIAMTDDRRGGTAGGDEEKGD
jgi:hypothetical protein